MRIDDVTKSSLLFDFYGQLLSKRQREVMELYHEENLSLSEIAAEFNISRQGVHDALKNAEKSLNDYEEKLGLVGKFEATRVAVAEIDEIMDWAIASLAGTGLAPEAPAPTNTPPALNCNTHQLVTKLQQVKDIIDNLEE